MYFAEKNENSTPRRETTWAQPRLPPAESGETSKVRHVEQTPHGMRTSFRARVFTAQTLVKVWLLDCWDDMPNTSVHIFTRRPSPRRADARLGSAYARIYQGLWSAGSGRPGRPINFSHEGRPINFILVGNGPAWPLNVWEDGPRPGPAHQNFRGWAATRPGPSTFQR